VRRPILAILLFALLAPSTGCTSVSSSAIRTDGMPARKHVGGVRIYTVLPPENVRVVGVVEVHALNDEANVARLMPEFIRRVAELGGTGAIVDHITTSYETRNEVRAESYSYPCGFRQSCWGTRFVPYTVTLRLLSIDGRALVPEATPPPKPAPAPKLPVITPVPEEETP